MEWFTVYVEDFHNVLAETPEEAVAKVWATGVSNVIEAYNDDGEMVWPEDQRS